MLKTNLILIIMIAGFLLFVSCREDHYTPKPRTYPRIDLPKQAYKDFELASCPFNFSAPAHAEIVQDLTFFNQAPPHPCWFNIHYEQFAADLFFSYHEVENRKDYDGLISDVYRVVKQVNKRSDYMEENRFVNRHGASGIRFDFEGPAASPVQFFISDTTQHFLKGSLYFNTQVNSDSLAPITAFIKEDIGLMLESFRWE